MNIRWLAGPVLAAFESTEEAITVEREWRQQRRLRPQSCCVISVVNYEAQ